MELQEEKPSPLKLILIRHGETLENASNIVQGHLPGRLSDKGKEQAFRIAQKLRDVKFDAVYSSDLARAFHTALILMEDRKTPPIVAEPKLREQNLGIYEGKPLIFMLRQIKQEKANFKTFNPQGGEGFIDFQNRVGQFLEEVKTRHCGQTVVLVTHYGVINVLFNIFSRHIRQGIFQDRIANGSIAIVDIDELRHATVEAIWC